jgi:hypothetical protein
MVDIFKLYISAANDLQIERDLLSRSVIEIPVTLGWQINLSPIGEKKVEEKSIFDADMHILILGTDIRAPIGFELYLSRSIGRRPIFFRKKEITRTLAANDFIRSLSHYASWLIFENLADLRYQALNHIGQSILDQADYYTLKNKEYEKLSTFMKDLGDKQLQQFEGVNGGAGENSVILSRERFTPKGGVLIQAPEDGDQEKQD